MIPHHQNAVNMAKSLLIANKLDCSDPTNEENGDCVMEIILREIINGQNHQIQLMRAYLDTKGLPQTDNCDVLISNEESPSKEDSTSKEVSTSTSTSAAAAVRLFGLFG